MIAGLFLTLTIAFLLSVIHLLIAKPEQESKAANKVIFFGYTACASLLLPAFLPVGGGV